MLKNYLKIAFKVFMRHKFFTFVSLFGSSLTLAVLVATFAIVLGGILIFQFALFDLFPSVTPGIYISGLLTSAGIIYLLVTAAALYPGWLATRVQPVAALHHE